MNAIVLKGLFCLFCLFSQLGTFNNVCRPGELYDSTTQRCTPCERGTFNGQQHSADKECTACYQVQSANHEVVISECSATTDTVVGCEPGYFRRQVSADDPRGGQCLNCTVCRDNPVDAYEARPCSTFSDTVCCPKPNMTVSVEGGSSTCDKPLSEKPKTSCRNGHYLYVSRTSGRPGCYPCRNGTYMDEDHHEHRSCKNCSQASMEDHEVVLENCTSTGDTIIGCDQDYYMSYTTSDTQRRTHNAGHTTPDTQPTPDASNAKTCVKCSECDQDRPYLTRTCGGYNDTVCCLRPGMVVKPTSNHSLVCVAKPSTAEDVTMTCPKGHYLSDDGVNVPECLRCERGTYMPISRHSMVSCEPCTRASVYLNEVELAGCTSVKDTLIVCREGYFRSVSHAGDDEFDAKDSEDCNKCSRCQDDAKKPYEIAKCGLYSDTLCCEERDMEAFVNEFNISLCAAPTYSDSNPLRCRMGQYVKILDSGRRSCQPCPGQHFMSVGNHTNQACKPCTVADDFNEEIVAEPCNPISDTVIACTEGFYRKVPNNPDVDTGSCTPCRSCEFDHFNKFEGQKCGKFSDTVCCQWPNMVVTKGENGMFLCVNESRETQKSRTDEVIVNVRLRGCLKGESVISKNAENYYVCLKCPPGSDTLEDTHTNGFCLNKTNSEKFFPDKTDGLQGSSVRHGGCAVGESMYPGKARAEKTLGHIVLCLPCARWTFMNETNHQNTACNNCTAREDAELLTNCTRTKDTVFKAENEKKPVIGEGNGVSLPLHSTLMGSFALISYKVITCM